MRAKRTQPQISRRRTQPAAPPHAAISGSDRRGSVLIAVLWLMALLWVVGIFFFLFANTEQNSAQYYSDAAKVDNRCGIDPDVLWDWALRQIIVGPRFDEDGDGNPSMGRADVESESSLYVFDSTNPLGLSPHSIVAHVLGKDLQPYNGTGIHLITDANGQPLVDMDRDGVADADQSLLDYNYSSVSNGGTMVDVGTLAVPPPAKDAGYTYPDINAPFLAYYGPDPLNPGTNILIPSYHRPQYLRDAGGFISNWDTDPTTVGHVFRAHKQHESVDSGGAAYLRYLQTSYLGPDGAPGEAGVDDDGNTMVDDNSEIGWPNTDDVLPFSFTTTDDGLNQVALNDGIWTGLNAPDNYVYDASAAGLLDSMGTPIREAIWMDLGFPVQSCDGKRYKPMFAITIFDADALLNLNAAGNTSGIVFNNPATPMDATAVRFNQSNQGLTPSELSLRYAFSADPTGVVDTDPAWEPYKQLFGINPAAINREVLANMETWFLLHGRGDYDATMSLTGHLVGRYGDQSRLETLLSTVNPNDAPQPGRALFDDDNDRNIVHSNDPGPEIMVFNTTTNAYDRISIAWPGPTAPTYNQPLDVSGAGRHVDSTDGRLPNRPDIGANPNRWVAYDDYDVTTNNIGYDNVWAGLLDWPNSGGSPANFNLDEADEIILLPGFANYSAHDAVFSVEEMATLHRGQNDPGADSIPSRLRELLNISLEQSPDAPNLRRQFTVESWDRIEQALSQSVKRFWESDNSAVAMNAPNFPPLVGGLAGGITDPAQPFRTVVIELLAQYRDQADPSLVGLQRKLDLNRHLVAFYTDANGKRIPVYRELTPHPIDPGRSPIPTSAPVYGIPGAPNAPATPQDQEYWARRDRQEKARDIYVLLYALCGGDDVTNPLTAPSPYTAAQLQQMAQFAVNVVDSLDGDNVITRFEYDTNLSNGWNVDDNPYSVTGDLDRAEVYGVEAASLTFSEALVFHAMHVDNSGSAQNHNATQHDDRYDWLFTYLELRNASPREVDTGSQLPDSTNERGGHWRIRIETSDLADPMNPLPDDPSTLNTLTLFSGTIPAGGTFTIGNNVSPPLAGGFADPNRVMLDPLDMTPPIDPGPTVFYVNPNYNPGDMGNFQQIVPRAGTPNLDLSLNPENGTTAVPYRINAGDVVGAVPIPGVWDNVTAASEGGWFEANDRTIITFVLERRAHLTREAPLVATNAMTGQNEENDNPWIEVDRIKVDRREFNLPAESGSNPTNIQAELAKLQSFERRQPYGYPGHTTALSETGRRYSDVHPMGTFANTLNQDNQSTPGTGFAAWQPHFDRHFASVMELLSVPLFNPSDTTLHLITNDSGTAPIQITNPMGLQTPPLTDRIRRRIAQEKFLFPDFDPGAPSPDARDNRWYRLFGFVEVPSKMHQGLGDITRVPGKLNLNTLRHPGVFGAMIDAPLIHNIDLLSFDVSDTGTTSTLAAGPPPPNRNWWREFVAARDAVWLPNGNLAGGNGLDPVTGRMVPGAPGTRPFRDMSHVDDGELSIEHTVLRQLLSDTDGRGLFEVGAGDGNPTTDNGVDYYMRHRLLSKVANHMTTRSHVYIVFIKTDYFEVVEQVAGRPQIGGKLASSPGHRGFFVVDVSDPLREGAYTPPSGGNPRGRFDFRKFVRYRRTIE